MLWALHTFSFEPVSISSRHVCVVCVGVCWCVYACLFVCVCQHQAGERWRQICRKESELQFPQDRQSESGPTADLIWSSCQHRRPSLLLLPYSSLCLLPDSRCLSPRRNRTKDSSLFFGYVPDTRARAHTHTHTHTHTNLLFHVHNTGIQSKWR